jgi:hypothetical protein
MNKDPETLLEDMMNSFVKVKNADKTPLEFCNADSVNLTKVVNDRIYALLLKESLSEQEIALLGALTSYRGKNGLN